MEQRYVKIFLFQLKLAAAFLLVALAALLAFSFTTSKMADDFWNQLGISRERGTEHISNGFLQGYINTYGANNMKNIAAGNRAQVVRDLGSFARQYVGSEAFLRDYLEIREASKPQPPEPAKSAAMLRTELVDGVSQGIKSMEEFLKGNNAELKKMAQESLPDLKKQLKDYQDPNNPMVKMMADGEKSNFEEKTKQYHQKLAKWEKDQPANPNGLVKNRLQEFLDETADIDFNAQLKERNGKMIFVNAAYEQKSSNWKKAFRAGKETVTAAREFAQNWLKEIK